MIERQPDFSEYENQQRECQEWLAKAHALVKVWDRLEAVQVQSAANFMSNKFTRKQNVDSVVGAVLRAISAMELIVPAEDQVVFGAGAPYEYFVQLNKTVASAESTIFIVDPYLDPSVFDHYVNSRGDGVFIRLLVGNRQSRELAPAVDLYVEQYGEVLEARKSNGAHDRIIFIDDSACFTSGQSLKDAAKAKPTYISPLAPDVVSIKLRHYEDIWAAASPLITD